MCFNGNDFCDGGIEHTNIAGRNYISQPINLKTWWKNIPIQYATQSSCHESYRKISCEPKHQHTDASTSKTGKQNRLSSDTITETSPENTS